MSLAKAREHLAKYGLEGKIMEFSASSASVVEAANAIGCKERETQSLKKHLAQRQR